MNFPYFIIDINNGIWYKDKKLGDKTINKMLRDICVKAGIDIYQIEILEITQVAQPLSNQFLMLDMRN